MGLGRWPDVSIAGARERAEAARRTVREGKDPVFERAKLKRVAKPLTVREVIDDCFEARKAELKGEGKNGRWMSPLLVHVIPKIGKYPIEEVDQHVLKQTLAPIWHEKAESAEKALNRIQIALRHAAALGLSVDLQATMKAKALLGKQRRTTTHIPSMPDAEVPSFYKWLKGQTTVSASALRLLILTVSRTTEVRLSAFPEFEEEIWTLPDERTKTGIDRRIPLVAEAQEIVRNRVAASGTNFLFPAYCGQPISDAAMATLMKRAGLETRPHGFRASFRTWVEEKTDAQFEVKESCLGHAVDTEVVGAYQRSDRIEKRRRLLRKWEAFLLQGG
jgi:integrase